MLAVIDRRCGFDMPFLSGAGGGGGSGWFVASTTDVVHYAESRHQSERTGF